MESFQRQEPQIRYLVQSLFIFGVVTAAVSLLHRGSAPMAAVLIPALWGFGALLPGFKGEFPPPVPGLARPLLLRGLKYYLWTSVVVFILYAAGFHVFWRLGLPVPTSSPSSGVSLFRFILYNITAVAFFEELFFRGYLQGRFEDAARHLLNDNVWVFWIPVFSSAFLFGAAHVAVDLDPARMAVFFPALLFGWLRAKTGSLIAPILSHATANVVMELLIRSIS